MSLLYGSEDHDLRLVSDNKARKKEPLTTAVAAFIVDLMTIPSLVVHDF